MTLPTVIHVVSGVLVVLAGTIAIAARKGGDVHVFAGRVFGGMMLVSAGMGALLGLMKVDTFLITFFAGILACYLIISGWWTIRRRGGAPGWAEICGALLIGANMAALILIGVIALGTETGTAFGFPGEDYFYLAAMCAIGLIFDLRHILRRGGTRADQLARHLWRMCLGFFIAAGSLFSGPGATAFPKTLRDSGLLSLPELLILATMIFWLVRIRTKRATLAERASD